VSWHQNGPGSKGYELFADGVCAMGCGECWPRKWALVRPIPEHRLWQFDGERYEATTETWHTQGKWVEYHGYFRTQREAKAALEEKFKEIW
jgi:hypothetical protein